MSVVRDRINDLRDAIQEWIEFASDYLLVDDDQYTPGPTNRAYFTFSLPSNITRGGTTDSIIYNKQSETFIQTGIRFVTVSIKSRGLPRRQNQGLLRGTDMLAEIEWTLTKPEVRQIFLTHGITIVAVETIVDTSDVEDAVLMPRGALDIRVSFDIREESSVTFIESFDMSGALDSKLNGQFEYEIASVNVKLPEGE